MIMQFILWLNATLRCLGRKMVEQYTVRKGVYTVRVYVYTVIQYAYYLCDTFYIVTLKRYLLDNYSCNKEDCG